MLNKLKLLEIIQRIPNELANFFSPGFALCSFIPRKEFKILCKLIDDLNMQQEVRTCGLLKDSIFICLHKFDDTGGIVE